MWEYEAVPANGPVYLSKSHLFELSVKSFFSLKKFLPHYPLLLSEFFGYLNGYMIWYIRWVVLESSPISRPLEAMMSVLLLVLLVPRRRSLVAAVPYLI